MRKNSYLAIVAILFVAILLCSFVGCEQTTECKHASLTHHDAVESTCAEDGNIEYWTCSECGKYFADAEAEVELTESQLSVKAKGHNLNYVAAVEALCAVDGNNECWKCDDCGKYFADAEAKAELTESQVVINAKGHNLSHTAAVEATCTTDGNIEYWTCDKCGKYFTDEKATNEIKESETVIAAAHSLNHTAAVEATCTTGGNIEYWTCDECGKYYADEDASVEITEGDILITANGHTFVDGFCTKCGAKEPTQGLMYKLNSDKKSYYVSGIGTATDKDIIIADMYEGLPVTSIGDYAFRYRDSLMSIVIPDSVTSIGWYAFYKCTGLISVTIGDGVTSIGGFAFNDCTGLISVTIGDGVTSIGERVFWNCTSLTSVTIGNSVTSIGEEAFSGCTGLTSIVIPDSVTSIGDYAFRNCTSLTSVTIGNSVTSIGYDAFYNCTSLTSVTIGNSVTSIGYSAFYNCDRLTSVTIGNSVTSIGDNAFNGCSSLTSIVIPESVTSIGSYAFNGCTNLIIYCKAESKPSSWYSTWNYSNCPVMWGYKG